MHTEAQAWIEKLQLQPHPEGGWYRESYRAETQVETPSGPRAVGTCIWFLLAGADVSHLHRLAADEIWHFYAGGPLTIHLLTEKGHQSLALGPGRFQQIVPAHTWFGSDLDTGTDYALVGCTMAPGFDFADFEMGSRASLLAEFPQHAGLIEKLT